MYSLKMASDSDILDSSYDSNSDKYNTEMGTTDADHLHNCSTSSSQTSHSTNDEAHSNDSEFAAKGFNEMPSAMDGNEIVQHVCMALGQLEVPQLTKELSVYSGALFSSVVRLTFSKKWETVGAQQKECLRQAMARTGFDMFSLLASLFPEPWGGPAIARKLRRCGTSSSPTGDPPDGIPSVRNNRAESSDLGLHLTPTCAKELRSLRQARVELLCSARCVSEALGLCALYRKCRACIEKYDYTEMVLNLLYQAGKVKSIVKAMTAYSCHNGLCLVHAIMDTKDETAYPLAECLTQILLVRDLLGPSPYCCTLSLMTLWCTIHNLQDTDVEQVARETLKLGALSTASAHFYLMVDVLYNQYGRLLLPLYLKLYIHAFTIDVNSLEYSRQVGCSVSIMELETHLATVYMKLAYLLADENELALARECVLTAFSLEPTMDRFNCLRKWSAVPSVYERYPVAPGVVPCAGVCHCAKKGLCRREAVAPPWYKHHNPSGILDSELEGISDQLLKDLCILVEGPRCRSMSWSLRWKQLGSICWHYLYVTNQYRATAGGQGLSIEARLKRIVSLRVSNDGPTTPTNLELENSFNEPINVDEEPVRVTERRERKPTPLHKMILEDFLLSEIRSCEEAMTAIEGMRMPVVQDGLSPISTQRASSSTGHQDDTALPDTEELSPVEFHLPSPTKGMDVYQQVIDALLPTNRMSTTENHAPNAEVVTFRASARSDGSSGTSQCVQGNQVVAGDPVAATTPLVSMTLEEFLERTCKFPPPPPPPLPPPDDEPKKPLLEMFGAEPEPRPLSVHEICAQTLTELGQCSPQGFVDGSGAPHQTKPPPSQQMQTSGSAKTVWQMAPKYSAGGPSGDSAQDLKVAEILTEMSTQSRPCTTTTPPAGQRPSVIMHLPLHPAAKSNVTESPNLEATTPQKASLSSDSPSLQRSPFILTAAMLDHQYVATIGYPTKGPPELEEAPTEGTIVNGQQTNMASHNAPGGQILDLRAPATSSGIMLGHVVGEPQKGYGGACTTGAVRYRIAHSNPTVLKLPQIPRQKVTRQGRALQNCVVPQTAMRTITVPTVKGPLNYVISTMASKASVFSSNGLSLVTQSAVATNSGTGEVMHITRQVPLSTGPLVLPSEYSWIPRKPKHTPVGIVNGASAVARPISRVRTEVKKNVVGTKVFIKDNSPPLPPLLPPPRIALITDCIPRSSPTVNGFTSSVARAILHETQPTSLTSPSMGVPPMPLPVMGNQKKTMVAYQTTPQTVVRESVPTPINRKPMSLAERQWLSLVKCTASVTQSTTTVTVSQISLSSVTSVVDAKPKSTVGRPNSAEPSLLGIVSSVPSSVCTTTNMHSLSPSRDSQLASNVNCSSPQSKDRKWMPVRNAHGALGYCKTSPTSDDQGSANSTTPNEVVSRRLKFANYGTIRTAGASIIRVGMNAVGMPPAQLRPTLYPPIANPLQNSAVAPVLPSPVSLDLAPSPATKLADGQPCSIIPKAVVPTPSPTHITQVQTKRYSDIDADLPSVGRSSVATTAGDCRRGEGLKASTMAAFCKSHLENLDGVKAINNQNGPTGNGITPGHHASLPCAPKKKHPLAEKLKCPFCTKSYASQTTLTRHIGAKHEMESSESKPAHSSASLPSKSTPFTTKSLPNFSTPPANFPCISNVQKRVLPTIVGSNGQVGSARQRQCGPRAGMNENEAKILRNVFGAKAMLGVNVVCGGERTSSSDDCTSKVLPPEASAAPSSQKCAPVMPLSGNGGLPAPTCNPSPPNELREPQAVVATCSGKFDSGGSADCDVILTPSLSGGVATSSVRATTVVNSGSGPCVSTSEHPNQPEIIQTRVTAAHYIPALQQGQPEASSNQIDNGVEDAKIDVDGVLVSDGKLPGAEEKVDHTALSPQEERLEPIKDVCANGSIRTLSVSRDGADCVVATAANGFEGGNNDSRVVRTPRGRASPRTNSARLKRSCLCCEDQDSSVEPAKRCKTGKGRTVKRTLAGKTQSAAKGKRHQRLALQF